MDKLIYLLTKQLQYNKRLGIQKMEINHSSMIVWLFIKQDSMHTLIGQEECLYESM